MTTEADRYRYDHHSGNIVDTRTGQQVGWATGDFGAHLAGTGIVHQRIDRLEPIQQDLRLEASQSIYAKGAPSYRTRSDYRTRKR